MIYVIVGLVVWVVISVWYFFSIMGYKFRKDKWYDYPLLAPVLSILLIARWISTLFEWNK